MGQPGGARAPSSLATVKRTQGTETSQYLEEEKSTEMSGVAASETDPSPNRRPCGVGVVGPADAAQQISRTALERAARDGESPVGEDEPVT
jgi:hypothetical protein